MKTKPWLIALLVLAMVLIWVIGSANAQDAPDTPNAPGTAFTYQGQLVKDGSPYSGACDFTFVLWDAATNGALVGAAEDKLGTSVVNGVFTVQLNEAGQFGANAFTGSPRWLQIEVKCGEASLSDLGRQALTVAPYASYAVSAGYAVNAGSVANGVVTTGSYADPTWLTSLSAGKLSGIVPIAKGGTGSAAQNFVDLSSAQTVGGVKTFSSAPVFSQSSGAPFAVGSNDLVTNLNADLLDGLTAANSGHFIGGFIPISNGTRNIYLNADLLDGAHAGNSADNLPLNNGVININLNADMLDGQDASAFQQHYKNVKVVAKSGGDYTTISAALNSITDNSSINPYLIWVAPGSYFEMITMKPYVDIQGAGEDVTKILSPGFSALPNGTIMGANNATLSFMTVENAGNNTSAVAIYNQSASPRLLHLTVNAHDGTSFNYGVYNDSSDPEMTLLHLAAQGTAGTYNYAVYNHDSAPVMTQLTIQVSSVSGQESDGIYTLLNYRKAPSISQVNITVSGSNINTGVGFARSSGSNPSIGTLDQAGINVTGGYYSTGIECNGLSYGTIDCIITQVNVTVSGGSNSNIGISARSVPHARVQDARINASGAYSYGVYNDGSSGPTDLQIIQSYVFGSSYSIYNFGIGAHASVGTSQLAGGGNTGTGLVCTGDYNQNFTPLNSACQ